MNIPTFFKSGKGGVRLRFIFFRAAIAAVFFGLLIFANAGCGSGMQDMVKSVQRGNEVVVLTNLRVIQQAQQSFSITSGGRFGTFDELVKSGLLNETFKGQKPVLTEYAYALTLSKAKNGMNFYSVNADPNNPNAGTAHFYIDSTTNQIKFDEKGPATAASIAKK
jgi:hypothetical protein